MKIEKNRIGGNLWRILLCVLICIFHFSFFNTVSAQNRISGSVRNIGDQNRNFNKSQLSSNQSRSNTPGNDSSFTDTSATKGLEYHVEIPDSVLRMKVFFFHYTPHSVKINDVWSPTLDPTGVHHTDPVEGWEGNYYLGKGIIGHAHKGLYPTTNRGLSYSLQEEEFEAYVKRPENIRFYQVLTPYTVLSYNNSLKKDYNLHLLHTQNIIPGWNVAFDYRLINPEGVLAGSEAKNHYLDVTTNYFSVDSRLQAQAGFIWQSFSTGENGGLQDDSFFLDNAMSNFAGLPVKLSSSGSNHLRHNLFARASYNFERQVDRTRERDSLSIRYDTVQTDSVVMVVDTLVVIDTLRVGAPHSLNPGVLGIEANYSRWHRAAYLSGFADSARWSEMSTTLFWTNDTYPDYRWKNPFKLTLGITPRRIEAVVRTDTSVLHSSLSAHHLFNPFAKVDLQLWQATLTARGELDNTLKGLSPKIKSSDWLGEVALRIPFDSAANNGCNLSGILRKKLPDVRMLYASDYSLQPIRSENYTLHFFHNSSKGFVRQAELTLDATHLDHTTQYDSTLTILVSSHDVWLSQATLSLHLALDWLHLETQQLFQHSSDPDQLSVPSWTSKNSLYADLSLFGNALRMQVGVDVRYYSLFAPNGYDPATGLFYMQDEKTGDYFWGDVFLNLQVKRASIYIKGGHLNALWESHPRYFLLPHYPGQQFGLFWGVTWHFFD